MILHLFSKYSLALHGVAPVFVLLTFFTLSVIALFSKNYLHDEKGRGRFWLLYAVFSMGILICGFSANLETFFVGWEMVGLASFFLIGFYQTNARSLENSLIALANYKMCDIFFVLAILLEGSHRQTLAGACLIIATLAKSAQFPFSSWLYRALEGPTPSSTVFYGGLSLHLGAFLLIQQSELWEHSIELKIFLGLIGLTSALYGIFVGSTRSDVKTTFAFASISQVGLIYIELACGFYHFALWHIVGHNVLRTWNYLRSASFFDDFFREDHHARRDLLGDFFKKLPVSFYFHAFNGFYMDQIFTTLRDISLIFFLAASAYFVGKHLWLQTFQWEYILLFLATLFSVYYFIRPQLIIKQQIVYLFLSQLFILLSIHFFYSDSLEKMYMVFSVIFLLGLIYALWPSLKIWFRDDAHHSEIYLGQGITSPGRQILYLFCCLSLTATPGSFQFFLQETLYDDLWNKSRTFMLLSLICLTLNSYHFFRLWQIAFLGCKRVEKESFQKGQEAELAAVL
jgi:NADH:ubiquinone oxidoreductase subunit 5 (subunit L)/multisubunit Na+/H+ antiporter MnhA subunit